jgi:hypothetical protein
MPHEERLMSPASGFCKALGTKHEMASLAGGPFRPRSNPE